MADVNSTSSSRLVAVSNDHELKVEVSGWGRTFIGSAAQIVATGLVRHDQMPGEPGRGKVQATYYDGEPVRKGSARPRDEKYLSIRRRSSQIFEALVGHSEEEMGAYWAAIDRDRVRREKEGAYREARERAERELASMPRTPQIYREREARCFSALIETVASGMCVNEFSGYSYDADAIREFRLVSARLHTLLLTGKTRFDESRRNARIEAINAWVEQANPVRPVLRLVPSVGIANCKG